MENYCTYSSSYFYLYGEDFPIEDFTKDIGINPTEAYRIGEEFIRGKNKHTRGVTAWKLIEDYVMTDSPEELIHKLVDTLFNSVDIIINYKEKYNLECRVVTVVNFKTHQTRGIIINNRLIEFAHKINAESDFDIYNEAFE